MTNTKHTTDTDLQDWLDQQHEEFVREMAERKLRERAMLRAAGSWEEQKFNFKRALYRKAIGA